MPNGLPSPQIGAGSGDWRNTPNGSFIDKWKAASSPAAQVGPQEPQGASGYPHWWDQTLHDYGSWMNPAKKIAADHPSTWLANVLNPIGSVEDTALNVTNKVFDTASRGVSTSLQAITWDNPLYRQDGFQLSDLGAMWDHSQTLTPAQAGANFITSGARVQRPAPLAALLGPDQVSTAADPGNLTTRGFDIYANEQKLKENNAWNVGTGVGDAAIQIAGAKGMGAVTGVVGKAAGLQKVAMSAKDLAATRDLIDSHNAATLGETSFTSTIDNTVQTAKQNAVGQNIERLAASQNITEIMNNPLVAGSVKRSQVASLIKDTTNVDTVKELVLADHGDMQAIVNLMKTGNSDLVWRLNDMNPTLAKQVMDQGYHALDPSTEKMLVDTFDTGLKRDVVRQRIYDTFLETGSDATDSSVTAGNASAFAQNNVRSIAGINYAGRVGQVIGAPLRPVVSRAADAAGDLRIRAQIGGSGMNAIKDPAAAAALLDAKPVRFTTLGDLSRGEPVTVLAKMAAGGSTVLDRTARLVAGKRALNLVTISGMRLNDVIEEVTAYMNGGATKKISDVVMHGKNELGNPVTTTMPMDAYRAQTLAKLADHVTDETAVHAIVAKTERDMVSSVAARRGVLDSATVKPFTDGLQAERDQWHQGVQDKGYFWNESGQRVVLDPQTKSQLASSVMLTDLNRLNEVLAVHGQGANWVTSMGYRAAGAGNVAFDAGQQAFRLATLYRVAYTPKNSMAEPLSAAYLAHGAMASQDGVVNAAREFVSNSADRLRTRALQAADLTGLTGYRRSGREVAALHQTRIDKERALESLDADIADAKNQSPEWNATHWDDLQQHRDNVNRAVQNIHQVLDGEDPGWRAAESASKFPSLMSLKADHAALQAGLTNPKHLTRLETNARSLDTRAATATAAGDAARAANLTQRAVDLRTSAAKWARLTEEDRNNLAIHTESLGAHIETLTKAAADPAFATADARAAAVAARDAANAAANQGYVNFTAKAMKREAGSHPSGARPVTINFAGGSAEFGGIFDPTEASGIANEFSAHNTQHLVYDPTTMVGTVKNKAVRNGRALAVAPGEHGHFKEWEYAVNTHLRTDPVVRRMMAGATDGEIGAWLTSPEGRDYTTKMGMEKDIKASGLLDEGSDLTNFHSEQITAMRGYVDNYLPTQAMRDTALAKPVRLSDLTAVPVEKMPTVSAGEIKVNMDRSGVNAINNAMGSVWDVMATHPENFFGRFPFARREYANSLQRRVDFAQSQGMSMSVDAINAMKYGARREALVNVEKTFYTIRRQNNLVHAMRYFTSYPAATINSFVRFNRLRLENPGRGLTQMQLENDIYTHFGVDENGNPVQNPADAKHLVFSLPGISPPGDSNKFTLNTKSLALVGGDIQPNWTVTIPMEAFSRADPLFDSKLRSVIGQSQYDVWFPYGTQGAPGVVDSPIPLDVLTPAVWKDFMAWKNPDSDRRREFAITQYKWDYANWMSAKDKFDNGQGPDPGKAPDVNDSAKTAQDFSLLMMVSHFFAPGSPNVQQAADYATPEMKAVQAFYQDTRARLATDPAVVKGTTSLSVAVAREMHAAHMDWIYPLIQSSSTSLFSMPTSTDAYKRYTANAGFIGSLEANAKKTPNALGVLFADMPYQDQQGQSLADPNVSKWAQGQMVNDRMLKDKATPATFASDLNTELAWQSYGRATATRDSVLMRYGGVDAQTGKPVAKLSDIPQLQQQWTTWFDQFSNDPANQGWLNEYKSRNPDKAQVSIRALTDVVNDPARFKAFSQGSPDPSYWDAAKDYLRQRASTESAYITLSRSGDTAGASELATNWDQYVRGNYVKSQSFLNMYDRYLGGNDLTRYDTSQKVAS